MLEAMEKLQNFAMRSIKRLADELYATDVHFFFVSPLVSHFSAYLKFR